MERSNRRRHPPSADAASSGGSGPVLRVSGYAETALVFKHAIAVLVPGGAA